MDTSDAKEVGMASISAGEARERFADVVNRAAYGKERVALTRHGKPVAAVVPIEDVELLEAVEDRIDLAEARSALAEAREQGTVTLAAFRAELGL